MKQIIHQCDGIGGMVVTISEHEDLPGQCTISQEGEGVTISHANLPIFLQQLKMYAESIGVKS